MDPPRLISLAVEPKTTIDRERLDRGLRILAAEDSAFGVTIDPGSNQTIIAAINEPHLEMIVHRLAREFGVEASVGKPQIAYKEMVTRAADGEGRFLWQAGGRGQYGHVKIHLSPREPGTGYAFENQIVGGLISTAFIAPIDEGIRDALARGILAGYPIDDVRVVLYEGSYHETDSSAMAFRMAGAMALQDAARRAVPVMVEPMMRIEIVALLEHVGDVIADLVARGGKIQSRETRRVMQTIAARAPLSQLLGYTGGLQSLTNGRATCSMEFDRYERRRRDPDGDDDDRRSLVGEPHTPSPKARGSGTALPEPDEGMDW
jgi:elongation factor G